MVRRSHCRAARPVCGVRMSSLAERAQHIASHLFSSIPSPGTLGMQGVLAPGLPGAMLAGGSDAASPLYRAVVRIQSRYRGYVVRKV